jgi:hypothetical protein
MLRTYGTGICQEIFIKDSMSMRATFTTEFIYDSSEGFEERAQELLDILTSTQGASHSKWKGGNAIGQLSGVASGLDLAESDTTRWIEEERWECARVTKVPFKIVWLLEGGDVIIKDVPVLEKK